MPHGGARDNAGRKSAYPGLDMQSFPMQFTPPARRLLDALQARTGLSRNNILAHLTLCHVESLSVSADEDGVLFPGKGSDVLSIRMPADVGKRLRAAKARTGKSFSDLGEALVRQYGATTTFPARPVGRSTTAPRLTR
jgi:hypothetical protein